MCTHTFSQNSADETVILERTVHAGKLSESFTTPAAIAKYSALFVKQSNCVFLSKKLKLSNALYLGRAVDFIAPYYREAMNKEKDEDFNMILAQQLESMRNTMYDMELPGKKSITEYPEMCALVSEIIELPLKLSLIHI